MGSKMLIARETSGRRVTLAMGEQQQYSKPLRCEFCEAAVEFVNAFFRDIGEQRVAVDPYFRLSRGQQHAPDCAHNVRGQISVIARKSEPDVLSDISGNRFELRLLAVRQAISQLRDLAQKKQDKHPAAAGKATEKQFIEAQERLGGYINSAARVLKVRAVCEDHAEVENLLHLVFDGVRIPWRDFFFDTGDYFRCFAQVSRATVQAPVAVQGTIKDIKSIDGKRGPLKVINLMAPYRKTDRPDVMDSASFSIWSADPQAFRSFQPGEEIVAFGLWESAGMKENANRQENSPIRLFRNHEMRLWPVAKSQVCAVQD